MDMKANITASIYVSDHQSKIALWISGYLHVIAHFVLQLVYA